MLSIGQKSALNDFLIRRSLFSKFQRKVILKREIFSFFQFLLLIPLKNIKELSFYGEILNRQIELPIGFIVIF